MQGDETRGGRDDEGLGPHLTQQSAQVDHWALQENKAREIMHYLQLIYFLFKETEFFKNH